ncbi:Intradiol ring-cleavage dioxygenase [Lineolata rhizophorae]|uniref:Intradiol ring-cleavage dioxygenase n=1 Tax=Lineolata rhizophorae TaxID=578093 RepID=A0A6A6P0M2_9PEZI|nr:Intradiol ring-cleavage dioxygenase [Lineolata rhizophorae]
MVQFTKAVTFAVLAAGALGHPGGNVRDEFEKREQHLNNPKRRTLADCHSALERRGHQDLMVERRKARVNDIRARKGLEPRPYLRARDLATIGLTPVEQPESEIFGRQSNCILDPEQTEGPYWVTGELVRSDLLDGEPGVTIDLDINVIDVNSCSPVEGVYAELWGANSTGVYTGVVASGNGDGSASEINNNRLRGIQPTDAEGTATFKSVVPGHYVGRTNHLHTIIHNDATMLPNNTIQGGKITHVGQFYFEQSLLQQVEDISPYSTNDQEWMQNSADMLYQQSSSNGDSAIVEIVLVGDTLADGVYGYIDVGINPSASYSPQPVNMWTDDGGIPVPGSMWQGYPWEESGGMPPGGFPGWPGAKRAEAKREQKLEA